MTTRVQLSQVTGTLRLRAIKEEIDPRGGEPDEPVDGAVVITRADITVAETWATTLRAKQAGSQKRVGDQGSKLARRCEGSGR